LQAQKVANKVCTDKIGKMTKLKDGADYNIKTLEQQFSACSTNLMQSKADSTRLTAENKQL